MLPRRRRPERSAIRDDRNDRGENKLANKAWRGTRDSGDDTGDVAGRKKRRRDGAIAVVVPAKIGPDGDSEVDETMDAGERRGTEHERKGLDRVRFPSQGHKTDLDREKRTYHV